MYNLMKKLIEKKFYPDAATVQNKLDVFFAMSRITEDEYAELTGLVGTMYPTSDAAGEPAASV